MPSGCACWLMLTITTSAGWVANFFFFFKQKTAYEVVSCDWSSDVCSSDLGARGGRPRLDLPRAAGAHATSRRAGGRAGRRDPLGRADRHDGLAPDLPRIDVVPCSEIFRMSHLAVCRPLRERDLHHDLRPCPV